MDLSLKLWRMLGGARSCSPNKSTAAVTSASTAEAAGISIQFNERDESGVGKWVGEAWESNVFRDKRFLEEPLRETCRLIRLCARWERFESITIGGSKSE